jgi:nucleotide-binding universal stress UspA family protein
MNRPVFRSILVATDLSANSVEVIRAAAMLAAHVKARMHVVHACDMPALPARSEAGAMGPQQRIYTALREIEAHVRDAVPHSRPRLSFEVLYGGAAPAILQRAEQMEADLIVLGAHRRRAVADLFLGATADKVIRNATVPCLIVRQELKLPLRRLLVPLDLSDPSRGALDLCLGWAMAFGNAGGEDRVPAVEVMVAHVVPRIFGMESFPFDREVVAPELDREVQGAVIRTGAATHVQITERVAWGDVPSEEILNIAHEEHPDLLVIATHGYGALLRALLGSVASHVARHAPCSVLLVPPAHWAADEPTVDAWANVARGFTPADQAPSG